MNNKKSKFSCDNAMAYNLLAIGPIFAITIFIAMGGLSCKAANQSSEIVSDSEISLALETQLLLEESVPSHRLEIKTLEGIVTITGEIENLLAKHRAAEIASTLRGVRAVVNNILVNPRPRPDQEIKKDIKSAFLNDPAIELSDLEVELSNGIVTLSGIVQSRQERELAGEIAAGIKGVRDINNQIAIKYSLSRSDKEMEEDIRRRLKSDVWVDAGFIQVEVTDGQAVLSGLVGSLAEKRSARSDAWVAGVTDVYVDNLEINWEIRDSLQRTRKYEPLDDEQIRQAVKDALRLDPRVSEDDIEVQVEEHAVRLNGSVKSLRGRKAAYSDARNTTGVTIVYNNLQVNPFEIPENRVLEERVRAALSRDPYVELLDIYISVVNGKVYMEGDVNNSFEKRQAETVASRVDGVVDVINMLDYDYEWRPKQDRKPVSYTHLTLPTN